MRFELEDLRAYLRQNQTVALPVAIAGLLLLICLIFGAAVLLPRWRLHTELARQLAVLEDAAAGQPDQPQDDTGLLAQQLAEAQTGFSNAANRFLTEAQAAAFLDDLYQSGTALGVSIIELQAQPSAPGLAANGEKLSYDTRHFSLVAHGELAQLNAFVGGMQETAVPAISLQNIHITTGAANQPDVLSLDLLLYTSPFSTGDAVTQQSTPQPVPQATQPSAAATLPPTTTPAADVSSLVAQLDVPWAAENWAEVIRLLLEIRQQVPGDVEMTEKLYAARVNYGYQLAAQGQTAAAAEQFEQALALFPQGTEAEAGLQSLSPGATAGATATPSQTVYVVQRGDTLYAIARRFGSTVDAVKAANGLIGNNITPGQQLIIP